MSLTNWQSISIALLFIAVNAGSTPLHFNDSNETPHSESIAALSSCYSCGVIQNIYCNGNGAPQLQLQAHRDNGTVSVAYIPSSPAGTIGNPELAKEASINIYRKVDDNWQVQSSFPDNVAQNHDWLLSSDTPVATVALTDRLLVIQAQGEQGNDFAKVTVVNFQSSQDTEEQSTQTNEIQIKGKLYRIYRDMLYSFSVIDNTVYIYPHAVPTRLHQIQSPLTIDLNTLTESNVALLSVVSDGENIWLTTEDQDTGRIRGYWQNPDGIIHETEIHNDFGLRLSQAQLFLQNNKPVLVPVSALTIDIHDSLYDADELITPFEQAC